MGTISNYERTTSNDLWTYCLSCLPTSPEIINYVSTPLNSLWTYCGSYLLSPEIINYVSTPLNYLGIINCDALEPSSQIDKIINKGVAHYSSCASTDVYKGLSEDGFKNYMKLSLREHDIPEEYKNMYLEYGENVMKDTSQNVHGRNIMFNNGSGSCVSISLMCNRDESNHFNLFVTSLKISCELDDEIYAYEDYTGTGPNIMLFSSENRDQIKNPSKSSILPKKEFENLFNFLAAITHEETSTKVGIEAPSTE